jgi:hypothetical protein
MRLRFADRTIKYIHVYYGTVVPLHRAVQCTAYNTAVLLNKPLPVRRLTGIQILVSGDVIDLQLPCGPLTPTPHIASFSKCVRQGEFALKGLLELIYGFGSLDTAVGFVNGGGGGYLWRSVQRGFMWKCME